jgi:hypothetical protein
MSDTQCTHTVGYIPDTQNLTAENWNRELDRFALKVEDFNVRGQRDQINHPGFIAEADFCSECGCRLDRKALGLHTLSQVLELVDEPCQKK